MHIKNGQVLTTGGAGIQDANLKQVSDQSLCRFSVAIELLAYCLFRKISS